MAPVSTAMLAMVKRSSMGRRAVTSPENSRALYLAPWTPIKERSARMRSLPPIFSGFSPSNRTFIVVGTRSQVSPSAQRAARSVLPTPVAKAPRAPPVQVWLSAPRMISPGRMCPCSGRKACSMPTRPCSQ